MPEKLTTTTTALIFTYLFGNPTDHCQLQSIPVYQHILWMYTPFTKLPIAFDCLSYLFLMGGQLRSKSSLEKAAMATEQIGFLLLVEIYFLSWNSEIPLAMVYRSF